MALNKTFFPEKLQNDWCLPKANCLGTLERLPVIQILEMERSYETLPLRSSLLQVGNTTDIKARLRD